MVLRLSKVSYTSFIQIEKRRGSILYLVAHQNIETIVKTRASYIVLPLCKVRYKETN